jgi:hypothetical protein
MVRYPNVECSRGQLWMEKVDMDLLSTRFSTLNRASDHAVGMQRVVR